MATSTARTVKDVNPHDFVKAYSAHLKRSGKVATGFYLPPSLTPAAFRQISMVTRPRCVLLRSGMAASHRFLPQSSIVLCYGSYICLDDALGKKSFVLFDIYLKEIHPLLQMELPEWVDIVKTARFKELPPYDPDWYYIRAASIARKIYLRQGIGVGGFQKIYGGRQRNGSRPPHFCKSSGAISRNILQQLQLMGIIDVDPKGGRLITSQGRRDLDQVAGRVSVEA
ncbi:hypothetical protein EJB05_44571, partial [Eragrostis curvula]